jgi:hypothetical protein
VGSARSPQRESSTTQRPQFEVFYARGMAQAKLEAPPVEFHFDQIRLERRSAEVGAELTVYGGTNGSFRRLHRTRLNLMSTRARTDEARFLSTRLDGVDWIGLFEDVCWRVIDAYRQGRPALLLRDAQPLDGGPFVLPPLALARDPVVLFGDGGAAKSYVGLGTALTIHTGRPLIAGLRPTTPMRTAYCDFEWWEWPHAQRMRALWGNGELPDLLYVPCGAEGPLSHQIDRLRGLFQQHAIEYAIVDSVALACDGPPEDAQVALAFFQALARLEVGSFNLAHVNRAGDTDKPFGSAFWHNSARATWFVRRVQEAAGTSLDLGLYQRKVNDGTLAPAIGLHFDFAGGRTTITRTELGSVPELAVGLTLKQRVIFAVRTGALTVKELSERLERSEAEIRVTVNRNEGKPFIKLAGNPYRVGLEAVQP